jgi:hypothetical protein
VTKDLRWPLVIAGSALVLVILTVLGVSGPVRVAVALWFLLVCTGMAFLPLVGIERDTALVLALVLLFSVLIDTVVAIALTLAGVLSETSALLVLVGLAMIGCWLQLRAARSSQFPDPPERLRSPAASSAQRLLSNPHR